MKKDKLKKRGKRTRNRIPVTFIVCEGKETEPKYFRHFVRRNSGRIIHVKTSSYKDIYQLVSRSEQEIGRNTYDPLSGDQIWCVCDCDENDNDKIKKAVSAAKKHGYHLIFSNPCFELWFLLHFVNQTAPLPDCEAVISRLNAQTEINGYRKNQDIYDLILPNQEQAINRAKRRMNTLDQNHIHFFTRNSNPATNVYELIEHLNSD